MLRAFREFLSWREGDAIVLGEANVLPNTDMEYFGARRRAPANDVQLSSEPKSLLRAGYCGQSSLGEGAESTKPRPATAQWGQFLRNHDELDLGRLSEEQRQAVFAAFAPEPDMQLYGRGIRRRLAPMLQGDRRRIELAYSLMMTLPGTPVIRYGDEIGMGDDLDLPERQPARTPMQWSTEPQGGFSTNHTNRFAGDKRLAPTAMNT